MSRAGSRGCQNLKLELRNPQQARNDRGRNDGDNFHIIAPAAAPVSIIPSLEFSICFGFSASEFEFHCDSILIATQLARH